MRQTRTMIINDNPKCVKCDYNIYRSRGGYGKICNGGTMDEHDRCPEWKIERDRRARESYERVFGGREQDEISPSVAQEEGSAGEEVGQDNL